MGWKNGQKVQRTRRTEEEKTWDGRTGKRYNERGELKKKRHGVEERAKGATNEEDGRRKDMGWKNGQKVRRTKRTEGKKTWNSRTSKRYDEGRELKRKRHGIAERAKGTTKEEN